MQEDEIPYKFEAPGLKMFHKNNWFVDISTANISQKSSFKPGKPTRPRRKNMEDCWIAEFRILSK